MKGRKISLFHIFLLRTPFHSRIFRKKSHQRREQFQHTAPQTPEKTALFFRNAGTPRERLFEIRTDVRETAGTVHPYPALKVKIETAVIEIDAAHGGTAVIAEEGLGVQESGRELVNLHAVRNEIGVIGTGILINHLLVRDPGRNDADIHTADFSFGRIARIPALCSGRKCTDFPCR